MATERKADLERTKKNLTNVGNVNKESSWSDNLYDEPWIYRQKENVIPKETFCSHKILKKQ